MVVAADAASFAGDLAAALGLPEERSRRDRPTTVHERFGTALVCWQAGRIDIASRRAESYPAPGALPVVRAGTPEQDLRRRDFTVNALAVPLGGARRGELRNVPHALEDLDAMRLRVLHERSFRDDPTRLLRLARYQARLGFEPERLTAELAAAALEGGALQTVSGARIGAELRLALAEPDAIAALAALDDIGVLSALHPPLGLDPALARSAVEMLPEDGRADLLLLACLMLADTITLARPRAPLQHTGATMLGLLDEMEFPAADRDRAWATAATRSGPGRAAARRRHRVRVARGDTRGDARGGGSRRSGAGRPPKPGRRRRRAQMALRAAPRAPSDQRRRPARRGHPGRPGDRPPARCTLCAASWTASWPMAATRS